MLARVIKGFWMLWLIGMVFIYLIGELPFEQMVVNGIIAIASMVLWTKGSDEK